MKQFSAPGSKTASIPLENPEGVSGERKQGPWKDIQKQGAMVKEKIQNGQKGDKRFEGEGGAEEQH